VTFHAVPIFWVDKIEPSICAAEASFVEPHFEVIGRITSLASPVIYNEYPDTCEGSSDFRGLQENFYDGIDG
jgi:hypothetical protein